MSESKSIYSLRLQPEERRSVTLVALTKGYHTPADYLRAIIKRDLADVMLDVEKSAAAGRPALWHAFDFAVLRADGTYGMCAELIQGNPGLSLDSARMSALQ